jgi:hypothetical protein
MEWQQNRTKEISFLDGTVSHIFYLLGSCTTTILERILHVCLTIERKHVRYTTYIYIYIYGSTTYDDGVICTGYYDTSWLCSVMIYGKGTKISRKQSQGTQRFQKAKNYHYRQFRTTKRRCGKLEGAEHECKLWKEAIICAVYSVIVYYYCICNLRMC